MVCQSQLNQGGLKEKGLGGDIDGDMLAMLLYADNIGLIVEKEQAIQEVFDTLDIKCDQ